MFFSTAPHNTRYITRTALILFILAASIRFATIWCGTNVDEGVYWTEGRQIYDGYLIYRDTQFNKTPLVALVAAPFFLLGDTPIVLMRIAMILLSLLGLYAIYKLALELAGPRVALAALALMAFEPYSCVWAKYLHTSTWAPWFEAGIFLLLISGLKKENTNWIMASGVLLGIYALSKQSAIFVIPPALLAWILFRQNRNCRAFFSDAGYWFGGVFIVFIPFCLFFIARGVFPEMWYDIWTAHHKMAGAFAHHTTAFRWGELKSMVYLAPFLWLLPLGSLIVIIKSYRREIVFLWIWSITLIYGNAFFISHVWRHYFLVCMVPAAILAGIFGTWLIESGSKIFKKNPDHPGWIVTAIVLLSIASIGFWHRNDWTYPGISLSDERKLAAFVERACPEPYLLNLTNPAFYVWTGKEIPPARRDECTTRIPFFMTIAGRGYMTREDMENTIAAWRHTPIGCVIAYDKYIRQIMEDPVMEPLRAWLSEEFKYPRRVGIGQTYYGWFYLLERKRE